MTGAVEIARRLLVLDRNRMSSQMLADSFTKSSRFKAIAAASTAEALSIINSEQMDIFVISADLDIGHSFGIQFARTLHAKCPELGIVILLDKAGRDSVIQAFRAGAKGVFARTEPISDFFRCVEQVSRGEIGLGKAEADFLLQAFKNIPAPRMASINGDAQLTKRELEVVQHAARGYTNKVIADKLCLSEHTVKNYLFRSFEKLGVSSRVELLFFLTMEGKNSADTDIFDDEPSLSNYCVAANKGFMAANSALSIFARGDGGSEKSGQDAYFWLRLAEISSQQIATRSRDLSDELKTRLNADEIQKTELKLREAVRQFPGSNSKSPQASVASEQIDDAGEAWSDSKTA